MTIRELMAARASHIHSAASYVLRLDGQPRHPQEEDAAGMRVLAVSY